MLLKIFSIALKILLTMLLYSQVSEKKFKPYWYMIFPLVYVVIFMLCPPAGYFGYFFIFVAYSFFANPHGNKLFNLFIGVYPIVILSSLGRLLAYHIFPLVGIAVYNEVNISIYDLLIDALTFPFYILIIKTLKLDFNDLKKGFERNFFNRMLLVVDVSMLVYMLIISVLMIFGEKISHADYLRGHINDIYILLFFVMLLYLNSTSKEKLKEEILKQKDIQLSELSNYSHHIENLYGEIRSFRHDYINILTSIKVGIDNKDIDAIKSVYEGVLGDSGKQLYNSKFDIAKLSNIKNDAVKSVLSAKLIEAHSRGVEIAIEIEDAVYDFKIDLLDFIKVMSILCDNAIEASLESELPKLTVALILDGEALILVVENSTVDERVNISHIFEEGYSSKGEGRGIGLHNVREILAKYPFSSVSTRSADYLFSQTITFRK